MPASGILALESRHAADFRMDPQFHPFHEVFLLLRGSVMFRLYGSDERFSERPDREALSSDPETMITEYLLQSGDYLVVPAGVGHTIADTRASTLVLVACTDDAVDASPGRREVWRQIVGSYRLPVPIRAGPLHLSDPSWRELIALSSSGPGKSGSLRSVNSPLSVETVSASGRLELENAFNRFLLELIRLGRRPRIPDARERVQAFAASLSKRSLESWTLDKAAGEVHLSRRRFSELWRTVTGETFVTTLQRHRIGAAKQFMLRETHSIAGAAFAAGFDDISHFYRVFHKVEGMPPGTWISSRM